MTRPAPGRGDFIRVLEGNTCKFRYEKLKKKNRPVYRDGADTQPPSAASRTCYLPASTGQLPARLYGPASSPGPHTCILPSPLLCPPKPGLSPSVGTRHPSAGRAIPFQGLRALPFPVGPVFTPFYARHSLPQAPPFLDGGQSHKSQPPWFMSTIGIVNGYHERSQNSAKGRTQRPTRSRVSPRGHRPHPIFRLVRSALPLSA